MSLVADIIASVKHKNVADKYSSASQLKEILKQSEEARVTVCESIYSRYDTLSAALNNTVKLQNKLDVCSAAMLELDKKIEDEVLGNVESSIGEIGRISERWKEVTGELEASRTLLSIHTLLEEAHLAQLNSHFHTSSQKLAMVEKLLAEAEEREIESQLDILSKLKEELSLKRNDLIFKASEVWVNKIIWGEESERGDSTVYSLSIEQMSSTGSKEDMKQMLMALYSAGELKRRISTFGKTLLNKFFRPIICKYAEVNLLIRMDTIVIEVVKLNHPKDTGAVEVLGRLREVFESLSRVFDVIHLHEGEEDITFMSLLGEEINEEFTELVLNDCIAEAVPFNRKELTNFDQVQQKAQELANYLITIGFFSPEQKSVLSYASDIETVFSKKSCAHHLAKARDLILAPLHVTTTVTLDDSGLNNLTDFGDQTHSDIEKTCKLFEKLLSAKTFHFPKCQVSVSACNLIDLIYDIMEEACISSPQYATKLFYTVRNILSLYSFIVPTAHSQTLDKIPQHAALVHNNSMFIAHHALILGHSYKNRLPDALRESSLTAVDLAHIIRKTGGDVFLKSMQNHRASLLSTLREGFDSSSLGYELSNIKNAELSVKQCLDQLERLHSVWQNVLPNGVYTRSIGTLVSSVTEDIVIKISNLQQISSDSATALINLLTLVKDNVPPLFKVEGDNVTSKGDVVKEVQCWGKLNELCSVLGASLDEVIDRWSDGKGPLALHFTPDEAKQLIRARFHKNTEKRAYVLSRMK